MWKSLKWRELQNNKYISISAKENLLLFLKSVLVIGMIDYCFYQSLIALLPLFMIGICFFKMMKKELLQKKKAEARQQFKEMLLLAVTGQKAGYSVENAFLKSYEDMVNLYGSESSICRMLKEIKTGLQNNRKTADLWKNIGNTCDIEEIREFAEVFNIAKNSSGDITVIMERTAETIGNKAETQKEIENILSARKLEQKIMNIMPFFLMLYISASSPGYFDRYYHSLKGMVIMTFCLLIYLSAYLMGVKVAAIEV